MTRAYLRLDPAFDEHKYAYPDGAYAALVATFCMAETQPQRGYFRSFGYFRALLGKRGRWASYLLEHGDVVELADTRVYVEGWVEWQEGDWKVGERVQRIRNRKKSNGAAVTAAVTAPVTPDVTVEVTGRPYTSRLSAGAGISAGDSPLPPASGGPQKGSPKRGSRNSRRQSGETLRASGRSPRQLLEGTPEVDSRALANLAERAAAWNAAHPEDQIPTPPSATEDDWIGGGGSDAAE